MSPTGVPVPPAGAAGCNQRRGAGLPSWSTWRAHPVLSPAPLPVVASVTPAIRGRNAVERLAALAGRLTHRDRRLCQLLHEHRVLTTPQLTELAFPSGNAAEHR